MTHRFTLLLSREITDDELTTLRTAGPGEVTASTDRLLTEPGVTATRLDFAVEGDSLAALLESALGAVRTVPGLTVPSVSVPADGGGR